MPGRVVIGANNGLRTGGRIDRLGRAHVGAHLTLITPDIGACKRYMSDARHVRAFGVCNRRSNDRNGAIKRGFGRAPAASSLPVLAPGHARNRFDHGPVRRCVDRRTIGYRDRGLRAAERRTRSGNLRLGHGRNRRSGTTRHAAVPATARVPQQRTLTSSPADPEPPGRGHTLANVADGGESLVPADSARATADRPGAPAVSLVVVCRDGPRMAQLSRALKFFAPDIVLLEFPAWDCQPYDRVSPHGGIVAQRMTTLSRLARLKGHDGSSILLTTVNAALQRVPAKELVAAQALSARPGNVLRMDEIVRWLDL